jgi:dihydromethanopterin reductase (acceptor)
MSTRMKIAWGITGGGHMLEESIDAIHQLITLFDIDLFISRAGEEVIKQYKFDTKIKRIKEQNEGTLKIISENQQNAAFPASAKLGLGKYQAFIISPMTGNTVAKCIHLIADTLITNCFMQALKSHLPILCVPTDFKEGDIRTKVPSGELITFSIDEYSAQNTRRLGQMKGVKLLETPDPSTLKYLLNS